MSISKFSRNFEHRLFILCLLAAIPGTLLSLWLLWKHNYSGYLTTLILLFLFIFMGVIALQIKLNIVSQFRTLTNLIEALSVGDHTLRGRESANDGALGELIHQINGLANLLTKQKFEVKETQTLLAKVISQIDVAIFTFDQHQRITLVNHAGAQLLGRSAQHLTGMPASQLGLHGLLEQHGQIIEFKTNKGHSRFHVATDRFIENNHTHSLLFLTNVQALLREEERNAWKNLIRVISHEINNSLTPIASLSQTLMSFPDCQNKDVQESLGLIKERAQSLKEFIASYQQLAKLPPPRKQQLNVCAVTNSIVKLYPEIDFTLDTEELWIAVDETQFKQLLINVIKNGIEAANVVHETRDIKIAISWRTSKQAFRLSVTDNGQGIKNSDNLFVPFYSTKPKGSGIGLVLCRQIAESHGGEFTLQNTSTGGCVAEFYLPLQRDS